eukprot:TRINITY_DN4124_c0_g1_i2.p1 TRINITY_DN4124_c0_g1~~TRINITY_DN4124_c0_g1_i2.p1  ORF type:complete len:1330 (+),score=299.02 TRINITY_DN4124_c0_g1_i2:96-4085(+)
MDSFRHPFPNTNSANNNSRYVPIPPPRFPDGDPNRHLLLHPHPQHHHHRPLLPLHHHSNTRNDLILPSLRPTYNPTLLSPPPMIFHPRPPRVSDPYPFRDEEPTRRSPPPLVWKDRPFPPRPPFVIHRNPNAPRIRFALPESENPSPLRRKRFNPDLERLEFERPWREFPADDRIDNSWSRDPRSHLRSHDLRRQVRRRTFPSDHFNDFDSTPMVGSHGHGSVERGIVERNPFERLNVQERISGIGGRVEASSSSGFLSNFGMDRENEVGIEDNGIRVGYGKRFHINKMSKGKRTMVQVNKPQKISALLRIQGGSIMNRKRNDEQFVQSSYFGDSNAAASQGESPVVFSDDRVKKVSSPVELDVSFKSDSLVAKPIFATNNLSTGSNKQSLINIKKKKKKVVDSVSHVPTSEGGKIDSNVTASSSHLPMKVSEKAGVSKAGPLAGSAAAAANDPGLVSSQSRVLVPLENNAAPAVSSVKENPKSTRVVCVEDDTERLQPNGNELATFDMVSTLSRIEGDWQEGIPAGTATDCGEVSIEVVDRGGNIESVEQTEVGAMEEHENSGCSEKCQDFAELHSEAREELGPLPLEVESLPTGAMEGDGCDQIVKEGLHQSDDNLREAVAPPISTSNSTKEDTVHLIDRLSRIDFPESLLVASEVGSLNEHQSFSQVSDENGCMDDSKQDEETADKDDFSLNDIDSAVPKPKVNGKSDDRMLISSHVITEKKLPLQSLTTKRPSTDLKLASEVLIGKKIPRQISGSLPPRAGFGSGHVKEKNSSTRIVRPRTWRRTDSPSTFPSPVHESGLASSPTDRQSPKRVGKVQTPSYIRKGNSLVRKSNPVAVATSSRAPPIFGTSLYRSNSANEDTLKCCMVSKRNVDCTDSSTAVGGNPSFERPKTPPLSHATKSVNCMTETSRDSLNSTLADPLTQAGLEIPAHAASDLPLNEDVRGHARTPENQAPDSVVSNLGTQRTLNDRKLKSPRTKKVIYVKRKSNQLVAAPRPEIRDSAVPITEKTHAVYFKRRKHQLVRNIASLKSQAKQVIAIPDDGSNSEGQSAPEISTLKCSRGSTKRLLDKVLEKTCKPSKFSLVWTLSGSKSHHNDNALMQRRKVLPCLFPWKRTTYRRSSISNITPVLNKSSSSLIKKLKLSQQRDTVYTRSTSGFSLRKSRVLSIGGSSLKWSKSIERRSKKASEEATLAVAAAERKKREQKRAASTAKVKDGNPCVRKSANGIELQPGERIFCVGSVRYKMDSSKRTLLRIPDEESSSTVKLQSEKSTRISFVPRRLLIGNDEYVDIFFVLCFKFMSPLGFPMSVANCKLFGNLLMVYASEII